MRAHRFLHIIVGFNAQAAANCAYNKTREVGAVKISGSTIKIIAGVFIFKENINAYAIGGIALIIIGVVLLNIR